MTATVETTRLVGRSEIVEIGSDLTDSSGEPDPDGVRRVNPETDPATGHDRPPRSAPEALEYDDIDKGDKIGSGGNADVYEATLTDGDATTTVAVKEPRTQGTVLAQSLDRFATEAETWSKLDSHDHILSVLGYDSTPLPWIALEYMDQGDLSEVRSQLNQAQKIRIASQVTDGVWHAHQRGVAHLDLKPQNILVRSTADASMPVAKVADWGLSKMLLDNSATVEGLSPQYSAPEQFDTESYGTPDNQTDIFQLGIVFYELFTGIHPFEGSTAQAMHGIVNESPTAPSGHDGELPDEIDDILLTAISKDKSDRYEAAVYLRDALDEVSPEGSR